MSGDIADIAGTASQDMYIPLYHSKKSYKTAADLGANRGQTSLELLMRFPMLSRVIAMEPDMTNFRKLGAAVRQDSRIEPYNIAAWDENAQITVFGDGSRGSSADQEDKSKTPFSSDKYPRRRFDSIIDGDCDLLHIDVEGSEQRALKGARETISRSRPDIMFRVSPDDRSFPAPAAYPAPDAGKKSLSPPPRGISGVGPDPHGDKQSAMLKLRKNNAHEILYSLKIKNVLKIMDF